MTKVINLFAGPSSGKSTTAAGLFHLMKLAGLEVELAMEYAKDLVWANRQDDFKYQYYVTAKQAYRIERLIGKVDYIITDSPILLGVIYAPKDYFPNYKPFLWDLHNSHDSINLFINRVKPYNPNGRNQTEEGAKILNGQIRDIFDLLENTYEVNGDSDAPDKILSIIKNDFISKG
jgi:nicotinamide riboside kinase